MRGSNKNQTQSTLGMIANRISNVSIHQSWLIDQFTIKRYLLYYYFADRTRHIHTYIHTFNHEYIHTNGTVLSRKNRGRVSQTYEEEKEENQIQTSRRTLLSPHIEGIKCKPTHRILYPKKQPKVSHFRTPVGPLEEEHNTPPLFGQICPTL